MRLMLVFVLFVFFYMISVLSLSVAYFFCRVPAETVGEMWGLFGFASMFLSMLIVEAATC